MKRIKFLSFATMVALMTLGFASCEKENFSMDIEIPQASPASVSISPNVIALIDGIATNVTNKAKIDCELPKADEDGKIAETTVTIDVEYVAEVPVENGEKLTTTLTAKEIVKVPALGKGMTCTLTPTIFLSVQTNTDLNIVEGSESAIKLDEENVVVKNTTNFYYTDVDGGTYQYKTGTEVANITWLDKSYEFNAEINNMINYYNQIKMETKKVDNITVYAQSQTIIKVTTEVVSTTYTIKKKVTLARSGETEVDIVTFVVDKYTNTTDNQNAGPKSETNPDGYEANIGLSGTGHGHGHGHGHGNSANAGGGIVWGE